MGLAQRSREVEAERQNKGREVDAGGNAAREGERDACGGRGAHFLVVRDRTTKIVVRLAELVFF